MAPPSSVPMSAPPSHHITTPDFPPSHPPPAPSIDSFFLDDPSTFLATTPTLPSANCLPSASPPPPPPTVTTRPPPNPVTLQPSTSGSLPLPPLHPSPQSLLPNPTHLPNQIPPDLSPAARRRLRLLLRRSRRSRTRPRHTITPTNSSTSDRRRLNADKVDKKTARVIRNREVALRARQAAKAKLVNLQNENSSLRVRATDLENENSTLKRQIETLMRTQLPATEGVATANR